MSYCLFTVKENGGIRECVLQGSGGFLGGHNFNAWTNTDYSLKASDAYLEKLLLTAREELEREGYLREFQGDHVNYLFRIRKIYPEEVVSARFVARYDFIKKS